MWRICNCSARSFWLLGLFILSGCHYSKTPMQPTRVFDSGAPVTPLSAGASDEPKLRHIDSGIKHAGMGRDVDANSRSLPEFGAKGEVTFQEAANFMLAHSDKMLAAQAGWQASHLQADALKHLRLPVVKLGGMAGRYYISRDISTDALQERLQGYGNDLSQLAQQLPDLAPMLSSLQQAGLTGISEAPFEVNVNKYDNFSHANITAALPLYTGGRIKAIQQYVHSRVDISASEVATTEEELLNALIKRYFQVQLAKRIINVRKAALKAVEGHDHAAQRMLDTGLISKVERLQAKAALSDARFQIEKAEDNLRLAQSALSALLRSQKLTTATDLFISEKELPPLTAFQDRALARYPVLTKIAAKAKQAEAVKSLKSADWKPNVSAFANQQIGKNRDWVVGINAQWTLHSSVDRSKMQQAAQATLNQVNAIHRQAQQDIHLLVEKNWLAVTNASRRYHSLEKEEKLAQQMLKLNNAGFKEGLNTVIEVNDAHAKLVKLRTQRANAAYEYVIALADLLTSSGDIHTFVEYIPMSTPPNKVTP